jgi:hypothetical protein
MAEVQNLNSGNLASFTTCEFVPMQLFPRKKEHIFYSSSKIVNLLLPSTYPMDVYNNISNLKEIEYNFYPDLGQKRTITAYVSMREGGTNYPVEGEEVFWRLADNTSPLTELNTNSSLSNSDGFAELEIKHPNKTPPKDKNVIKVQASFDPSFLEYWEIEFLICRNDDVKFDLIRVLEAKSLLVYQVHPEYQKSEGVKRLQELLNQVVSRHKKAINFKWLTIDGEYGESGKTNIKEFLANFGKNFDYEKGRFNVKVDDLLIEYIRAEYGVYEDGNVVDKHLLIGEKQWVVGESIKNIDGLLDIYEGVVKTFFSKMEVNAELYISNFNVPWLHHPEHAVYEQGDEISNRFVLKTDTLDIKNVANGPTILETIKKGATIEYMEEKQTIDENDWYKVKTTSGIIGWCSAQNLLPLTNDIEKSDKNLGNYGTNGVAYSFGGKDLPNAFISRLNNNNPTPDQIKSWNQYNWQYDKQKVSGGPGDNWERGPGNGCDCGGFVQNCITESKFEDHTLIVRTGIKSTIAKPENLPNWPWNNTIASNGFIGDYARQIPYKANNEKKQWVDKTDIIYGKINNKHIVWVADEHPITKHPINDREFNVYNEYGGTKFYSGVPYNDRFTRKAVIMPFKAWGNNMGLNHFNTKVGRIYFWK